MSVRSILLVEDTAKLRRLYSETLEAAGYNVVSASDGAQALGLLTRIARPQLVILDIMMPGMNGIEACQKIRLTQPRRPSPVLFLTVLDRPEVLLECLKAGGDDFLMKSAPLPTLLKRVHYWTRQSAGRSLAGRRRQIIRRLEAQREAEDTESTLLSVSAA